MVAILFTLLWFSAYPINAPQNAGFEDGLQHWNTYGASGIHRTAMIDGRRVAHLRVPDSATPDWNQFYQEVPFESGGMYQASVEVRADNIRNGHGALLSLSFFDENDNRLSNDVALPVSTNGWTSLTIRGAAPPETQRMSVLLLFHGNGDVYFDNVELLRVIENKNDAPGNNVTLTVTDEIACESLIGFGAEDDGWHYNANNAARGVDDGDHALREGRIEWMDPDFVRMFHWYHDWNPSLDWQTFDWETDGMRSHYRALDVYQRIGAAVHLTGVEWAMPEPWSDVPALVNATGELLEHLIKNKGYTCIQYWSLTNEPNSAFVLEQGGTWETYVEIHRQMREEFVRRGLDIQIISGDDAQSLAWFRHCIENDTLYEVCDAFSSHHYWKTRNMPLLPLWFEDHLAVLKQAATTRGTKQKPFVLAEYGFDDGRNAPPATAPGMRDYPYALQTQQAAIDALDRGTAALNIWCLHETYYIHSEYPMQFGLWDYKDNNWKPRPVYYPVADLCRLTETGDTVRRVESTRPTRVRGVVAGNTLFWVNLDDATAEVAIKNFKPSEIRIHTEDTLEGDRESGVLVENPESGHFTAPPRSFGYARVGAFHRAAAEFRVH